MLQPRLHACLQLVVVWRLTAEQALGEPDREAALAARRAAGLGQLGAVVLRVEVVAPFGRLVSTVRVERSRTSLSADVRMVRAASHDRAGWCSMGG